MTGSPIPRRSFLVISAGAVATVAGCGGGDSDDPGPTPTATVGEASAGSAVIDFSAGDAAVLNFAYALEQLEAAFYEQVNAASPSGLGADARRTLVEIGGHEVVHREFLKAALGKDAIGALVPDFSSIDLTDAKKVLAAARDFEDLGVAAYNGAAQFLDGNGPLGMAPLQAAGEIVSVEARHASAIRTLIGGDSSPDFAPRAFDDAKLPGEVLAAAQPFIKTKIQLRNAPDRARS